MVVGPSEALAQIRLNVGSVDNFLAIVCSLADDNPPIRERVFEAAREARAACLLVEHLRDLFSHAQAAEAHRLALEGAGEEYGAACYAGLADLLASAQSSHANPPPYKVGLGGAFPQQPQGATRDLQHEQQRRQQKMRRFEHQHNARLFAHSNRLALARAAKSLVSNVAKMLYLADSVALAGGVPTEETWAAESWRASAGGPAQLEQAARADKLASIRERLDNVANYSQLLRAFGELSSELVDLGLCIMLSGLERDKEAEWLARSASSGSLAGWPASSPDEAPSEHSLALQAHTETQIQDMQALFQVNRLIIDRSILLLLSTSKCCLRQGDECLRGLEARRSVAGQIRASISIIMAIVKYSVFGGSDQRPGADKQADRWQPEPGQDAWTASWSCHELAGWPAQCEPALGGCPPRLHVPPPLWGAPPPGRSGPSAAGQHPQQAADSLHIMNYFLQTFSGSQSAHEAINRLQELLGPFAEVADYKSLTEALAELFLSSSERAGLEGPLEREERRRRRLELLLMDKRQLAGALNALLLGEPRASLVERVHEFTDCAYTRHEQRETILTLLQCIKMQLGRFVKLLYRHQRRRAASIDEAASSAAPPDEHEQLRQLAGQLVDSCEELKFELQTVVIEQSDELDRANGQLDLVKQMKHHCLVGDRAKSALIRRHFGEQTERLLELCRMLNQVAPTHKMRITTKTLAIWFESNVGQLLGLAACLADNPRSRVLKDCFWVHLQVWCSFYDDFCQSARQVAYVTHAQFDPARARRVTTLRARVALARQRLQSEPERAGCCAGAAPDSSLDEETSSIMAAAVAWQAADEPLAGELGRLAPATSIHSLSLPGFGSAGLAGGAREGAFSPDGSLAAVAAASRMASPVADSPRSLDHYYGFGANYRRARMAPPSAPLPPPSLPAGLCEGGERGWPTAGGQSQLLLQPTPPPALQVSARHRAGAPAPPAACLQPAHQAHQPPPPSRRVVTIDEAAPQVFGPPVRPRSGRAKTRSQRRHAARRASPRGLDEEALEELAESSSASAEPPSPNAAHYPANADQSSSATEQDKWSDSDADAIIRGARETAQMALAMYQFTRGEGELNTTQDLFTQAEMFAEEANELYKEVRCFSYKVPTGELKKELLTELANIPALVQQLQFIVKNPTVGEPATFAKVDSVIRETRSLMEAVNRVVTATLACRQHYNMAVASMRKRTRTLSPSYRADKGFEFDNHSLARQASVGGRHAGLSMGSEPDI